MPRRILAAVVAALAIVALARDRLAPAQGRLSGEPTTTTATTPKIPKAPKTGAVTTTTDLFGNPDSTPPSPLTLYPRRPGAKYEDVEARPAATVQLGLVALRVARWSIAPHSRLPKVLVPTKLAKYEKLGLADGYAPSSTSTPGDLLHVIVHVRETVFPVALACVATVAADGTVLIPYARPAPPRVPTPRTSASTTSTTELTFDSQPHEVDIGLYLPLGARRGRVYLTCRNTFFDRDAGVGLAGLFSTDSRVVWAIDV